MTAIIIASFGTTHNNTRALTIDTLVKEVSNIYTEADHYIALEAYTSSIIRRTLKERGIIKPSIEEALNKAVQIGANKIVIQPTHLMYGIEYNKVLSVCDLYKDRFTSIITGTPLLANKDDIASVLQAININTDHKEDEAIVLIGHGSKHYSNFVYAAMDYEAKILGYPHIFVGTIESYPRIEEIITGLHKAGYTNAVLMPLMLVAGEHATKDIAGNYSKALQKEGISIRCILKGLGEYHNIRAIYLKHIEDAIKGL